MNVGSTKELSPEKRISITPETSKSFKNLGLKVFLEKGFGESLGFSDKDYVDNGVEILSNSSDDSIPISSLEYSLKCFKNSSVVEYRKDLPN